MKWFDWVTTTLILTILITLIFLFIKSYVFAGLIFGLGSIATVLLSVIDRYL